MKISSSPLLLFSVTIFSGSLPAEIIDRSVITDFIDQTPGFFEVRPLGVTITNDSAVFLVGTINFDTEALGSSFVEANMGDTTSERAYVAGFGNGFGNTSIVIAENGTRAVVPEETFVEGVPRNFVIKFNQTTGETILWVDPDLTLSEELNTVDASVTIPIVNGSSFDGVVFRAGDFDEPKSVVDFTDFSVYYNGDSPFGVIPKDLPLTISTFSYDPATGDGEVVISGSASAAYILVQAYGLDFSDPDESPMNLITATVGTLNGNEVTTDENGDATVQFNLGTSNPVAFLRAEVAQ